MSGTRTSTTGITGTGRTFTTDYESRTGTGSGSYSGSPYTGTGSIYSPFAGTGTGSPYTGTGSPYTSTMTYSSPYTRSGTPSSYMPTFLAVRSVVHLQSGAEMALHAVIRPVKEVAAMVVIYLPTKPRSLSQRSA
ncbi:hypothetical protein FB446DRAFT_792982 [Lentinula raphanica]|nr:hypothetical protein FB446DRAFT_792982 [Lentinula raphanica]